MIRRLLALLLTLAPGAFRERYGEELLELHDQRVHTQGPALRRVLFGLREALGLLGVVLRLRFGGTVGDMGNGRTGKGGTSMFEHLRQDIRFAARTLKRNPGFTATAVAVLTLGIGANTAMFSAVNAFLFRPLPFGHPDRLVMLYETNPDFGWVHGTAAPANVLDWREQVGAFEDIATYSQFTDQATNIRDGEPELLGIVNVSGNFFSVLGVRPALGRIFRWEETWAGSSDVVVLSHDFWVSHFGADPDAVGRTMKLGSTTVKIVGVMPAGFDFPNPEADMWSPWGWDPTNRQAVWFRRAHWVEPIARLKPGVTLAQADAELQTVVRHLQSEYPETNKVMGAGMMPLRDFLVMDVHYPLLVLLGAVGVLLLLACTNVANLMLVRASDRTREVALRFALGSGRWRVVRQILTEGVLLALAGGTLGLALGWLGIEALGRQRTIGIRGATTLTLDWRVVAFTVGAALASTVLFALAPALRATRGDVQEALKDGGRGGSAGRGSLRTARALVAVELSLAVLLVAGAGLMMRTFWHLRGVDPGFRTQGVLAVQFGLPSARYANRDQVLAFQDQFERRLRELPGIRKVGIAGELPLHGTSWTSQFQAEGWPPDQVGYDIIHCRADSGYFQALDVPLLHGRLFGPDDGPDAPKVVVINETFARQYFPGEDPVGKRIAYDQHATPQSTWREIVGVVGDQLQLSPAEPARAEVYEPRTQDWNASVWYVVRTSGEARDALPAVRSLLHEMDPLIALGEVRPLSELWRASMAQQQFILTLLGVFGVMALLLAAVGVYGVTAQAARKRTQEIGIRLALGADGPAVVGMMLRQGLTVVAVGLVVGVLTALLVTRAMATLLYGVKPYDPATLGTVVAVLGAVALAACYLPARRATGVDPVTSLRTE